VTSADAAGYALHGFLVFRDDECEAKRSKHQFQRKRADFFGWVRRQ
jgi:hypothetical protein